MENTSSILKRISNLIFSDTTIFFLAFGSMFGSLFFQYYLNLPPCALCIIQRYFMYPMAFIAAFGVVSKKRLYPIYLALSLVGGIIATYHVYIEQSGTPSLLNVCTEGQSCNDIVLELFGFLTIPMMSLGAFIAIFLISVVCILKNRKERNVVMEVTNIEA